MFCPKCAAPNLENATYCRSCGLKIMTGPEPAALNGRAIAKFIIGDAFVLPAVLLMALESSVQTALWILLAVPGLLLYSWAIADIVRARAITGQRKKVPDVSTSHELPAPLPKDLLTDFSERPGPISVTERTTRDLVAK